MNGAMSPDPQTPAAAVIPMALRLQFISSEIKPWIPPNTTPAKVVATKVPKAPVKRMSQP
jgi:hypothetical protein